MSFCITNVFIFEKYHKKKPKKYKRKEQILYKQNISTYRDSHILPNCHIKTKIKSDSFVLQKKKRNNTTKVYIYICLHPLFVPSLRVQRRVENI